MSFGSPRRHKGSECRLRGGLTRILLDVDWKDSLGFFASNTLCHRQSIDHGTSLVLPPSLLAGGFQMSLCAQLRALANTLPAPAAMPGPREHHYPALTSLEPDHTLVPRSHDHPCPLRRHGCLLRCRFRCLWFRCRVFCCLRCLCRRRPPPSPMSAP